jgi:hypothetical protein
MRKRGLAGRSCPAFIGVHVKAHVLSFVKAPVGYVFNLVAHFGGGRFVCWGCETFCLRDGVQDEVWF